MTTVGSSNPRAANFARVLREEATVAQPLLWLANVLGRLLPTGTGPRFRARLYRACGIQVGSATSFHGPATFVCCRGGQAKIVVGNSCRLNSPLYLDASAPITLGNGVAVGHHVVIVTTAHEIGPPEMRSGRHLHKPVTIGDGAWIAANVTLLPGVTIGRGAVVAAGSVVTRDVPDNTLVGGVPARVIRKLPG
ncbi:MAG: acyltransferase [Fibrella sp.]|nr:acyltransferase [Armatimonadota bacterium]